MQAASSALITALKSSLADVNALWAVTGIEETSDTAVTSVTGPSTGTISGGTLTLDSATSSTASTTVRTAISLAAAALPLAVGSSATMRMTYTSVYVDGAFDHGEIAAAGADLLSTDAALDATIRGLSVGSSTMVPRTDGTAIGDMTSNAGLAAAFDGVTSQSNTASAGHTLNAGTNNIGKDWGSGVTHRITSAILYATSDSDFAQGAARAIAL